MCIEYGSSCKKQKQLYSMLGLKRPWKHCLILVMSYRKLTMIIRYTDPLKKTKTIWECKNCFLTYFDMLLACLLNHHRYHDCDTLEMFVNFKRINPLPLAQTDSNLFILIYFLEHKISQRMFDKSGVGRKIWIYIRNQHTSFTACLLLTASKFFPQLFARCNSKLLQIV